MKEDWIYKRGDLYYANLNPYFGSEQGGTRPVLVLQNNVGNFFCPTLIVAPLTSKWIKKKELPTHYALESVPELGLKSVVLLEQIKTIDKRRVLSYIGRVSREEMRAIDDALQVSLGQHRTIAEASAVESPIRQETIGFPAHFFARAHNFKPPGRACQPEADSPMRT